MMDESDLEPEVPHALLVRLNQVGTILRPVLDYAGEGDKGIHITYSAYVHIHG